MHLEQIRECDGQCCRESPRWPNAENTDCIFHKGDGPLGCELTLEEETIPAECPRLPSMTGEDAFYFSCRDWPESMPVGRGTRGCCLQWIDVD